MKGARVCIICGLPIEGLDYWVANIVKDGDSYPCVYSHLGEKHLVVAQLRNKNQKKEEHDSQTSVDKESRLNEL